MNDVVLSLNLGISPLSYLFVSLVAAYIRAATVRSTLISDWFTFVIAIMGGNFITFILIKNFSDVGVNYTDFFYNSLFTFILYPAFWSIFELYKRGISLRVMINSTGESKSKLIGRRMFIISAAKAVVVFGILGRLVSLQINESKKYKTLSDKNRFREWKISPPRGTINDYY